MIAFMSAGAIQLFVAPASRSSTEQMNVRSSTRATSLGSDAHQNEFGFFAGSSRRNVPASTSRSVIRRPLLGRAVAPLDPVGRRQLGDLADPFEQSGVPGRGRVSVRTRDR